MISTQKKPKTVVLKPAAHSLKNSDAEKYEKCHAGKYARDKLFSSETDIFFSEEKGKSDCSKMRDAARNNGIGFIGNSMEVIVAFILSQKNIGDYFTCAMVKDWYLGLRKTLPESKFSDSSKNRKMGKTFIPTITGDFTSINHGLNQLCCIGFLTKNARAVKTKKNHQYHLHNVVNNNGIDWFFSKYNLKINGGVFYELPHIEKSKTPKFPFESIDTECFITYLKEKYELLGIEKNRG